MKTLLYRIPITAWQYWLHIKDNNWLKASLSLMLIVYLFVKSGFWLRSVDATAAPIDIGILSMFPLLIIAMTLLIGLTLITQEWLWPALGIFRKKYFIQHFNTISPWQQFKIYGLSFCLLLLFSVLVLLAIL